jgi:hypothetical protein
MFDFLFYFFFGIYIFKINGVFQNVSEITEIKEKELKMEVKE